MRYAIYILLAVFAAGAVSTTSSLLEPVVSRWRPTWCQRTAFTLPEWFAYGIGAATHHSFADAFTEGIGSILAMSFLLFRNDDQLGWMLQDTIAVLLLLSLQRTTRLPNLKVGTVLLVCTFFFDIFWVFLSPLLFKKSVMIEVATGGGTGQSVPMVLKIPGDLPGQFKILGLGDIAIPGLFVSFLLRHDWMRGSSGPRGYFIPGLIGYAVGLGATFLSLYVMEHGQPALLFLVPGVLLPTFAKASRLGELHLLWNASYGPAQRPEGYDSLDGDPGKQA